MAEVLGLAASLIAVIQLADRIASICKLCIESLEDCPKDFRMILVEISSTRALFDSLHFLQRHDPHSADFLKRLGGTDGSITACYVAIKELQSLLPYDYLASAHGSKTTRQKAEIILKTLAWPLKQNKAKDLLDRIFQHKITINTAFSIEVWQNVRDLKHGMNQVQETLSNSQRHDICAWLQQNDPSPIHNIACGIIEEGTCSWVFRLPEWIQWINLQSRCLWIHGIPGCGKTVLAARLIEQTRRLCDEQVDARCVSVYYYCHHSRNKDESTPFLRWLVSQLSRKAERIPKHLHNMYKTGCEPNQAEILACLQEALGWFDTVFIIIDALDESRPRAPLLSLLQTLMTDTRFRRIQLLSTSREYLDIQQTMAGISQPIPMAHPYVETDIAISVRKVIESDSRFREWPHHLRDEVVNILSKNAKGMFRWAMCQLDILRHAGSLDDVAEALCDLPPTLDDTYHRIFSSVPREDMPLLRHVLQILCFHDWLYNDWTQTGLSYSLIISTYTARSGRGNHLYSLETLREICGCLVAFPFSRQGRRIAMFAHYTVREFLESDRVLTSSAAYFALHKSNKEIIEFVFQHALTAQLREPLPSRYGFGNSEHCIYTRSQSNIDIYSVFSASAVLYDHEEFIVADDGLSELAYQLLDPVRPSFNTRNDMMRLLLAEDTVMFRDAVGKGQRFWDIRWKLAPVSSEVGILTILLWSSFFDLATKLHARVQPQALVDTQLSLSATVCELFGSNETAEFQGTITEFFTEYSSALHSGSKAVVLLTNLFLGKFDFNPVSASHVASHSERHDTEL